MSSLIMGNGAARFAHALRAAILLAALAALTGCGETVAFNVLRAPKVNVKAAAGDKEPTVSVGKWTSNDARWNDAAQEIAQHIREAVTNAPGGAVKFAEAGGAVTLTGTLADHGYSEATREERGAKQQKSGNEIKRIPYTRYIRTGKAKLRVSMNVIDASGRTLAAETVPLEVARDSSAEVDDGDQNSPRNAPAIEWDSILAAMRAQAAEQLARAVVPYPVVVTKPWFKCGELNETCKAGLVQLRAGNFAGAIEQFQAAEAKLAALPKPDPAAHAAAFWALTLGYEFGGEFDKARASLDQAIKLNPSEEAFAAEGTSIKAEQANANKLSAQGVSASGSN